MQKAKRCISIEFQPETCIAQAPPKFVRVRRGHSSSPACQVVLALPVGFVNSRSCRPGDGSTEVVGKSFSRM